MGQYFFVCVKWAQHKVDKKEPQHCLIKGHNVFLKMGHFWVTTLVPWTLPHYHSNITCWYPQFTFLSQHTKVFVTGQNKNIHYQKHCTLVQLPLNSQKLIIQKSVWEIPKDNTIFWKSIVIYETGGTLDPLLCNAHRYYYTFVGVSCHTCLRVGMEKKMESLKIKNLPPLI